MSTRPFFHSCSGKPVTSCCAYWRGWRSCASGLAATTPDCCRRWVISWVRVALNAKYQVVRGGTSSSHLNCNLKNIFCTREPTLHCPVSVTLQASWAGLTLCLDACKPSIRSASTFAIDGDDKLSSCLAAATQQQQCAWQAQ